MVEVPDESVQLDALMTILATRCASRSTRTSRRGGESETFGRANGGVGDPRRTRMRIAKYSELEGRIAEFEEELRRDPHSFAPLPQR